VVIGTSARKKQPHDPYDWANPGDEDENKKDAAERRRALAPRPQSHMDNLPRPDETPEAWYARIVGDYYRFLYATAYPIVRNAADAEDAVQQAVLNGLKRLDHLNDPRAIVSWLAMIVRNAALDVVRKRKRTAGHGSADAEEIQVPADAPDETFAMDDDQREIVFAAVAELPASQAAVITLRHVEGLEIAELADRLDITANNARVRLFRAYEKLRANPAVRTALGMDIDEDA
jgi:RNA polymerase sigma-70 factor (ECF subfamily)